MPTLQAHTNSTREHVFALLTDYERYVDWTPDVIEATLLAREGDIVVAEFLSPELMPEKYQLEFVQDKPSSIIYRQKGLYEESGQFDSGLHGSWQLKDAADGPGVIVTGTMAFDSSRWHYTVRRKSIEIILQRRLDVIQQMFLPRLAALDQGLSETEQRLVRGLAMTTDRASGTTFSLWFHGYQYALKKVDRS